MATLLTFVCAAYATSATYFDLPFYDCSDALDNYALGHCLGVKSSHQAKARWNSWDMARDLYTWIRQNQTGNDIYQQFLSTNQEAFPSYLQEAHGIANGSGLEFEQVFIMV